jgi:cell division protein FtsA
LSKKSSIVCGLDVGTTKVCMMIARAHADNSSLELIGTGYADSSGLVKGIVVDLEQAAASIRKAADEAESAAGVSVDWTLVGASGDHFESFNTHGALSIEGTNHEVTPNDMEQVIQAARSVSVSQDREIIHVLPQEFLLDNHGGIQNPVGLTGSRLDVNIHIVTCESALNQNLIHAVNRAQMRVRKVCLQQLASAEAVLTRDERELGTVVIDIGGGTTDIAIFNRNAVRFTSILPVGGAHFTRDIALMLQTPMEDAERIKKEYGTVQTEKVSDEETIEVHGIGTQAARSVPRKYICEILRARGTELLELVKEHIWKAKESERLVAGVVLTGGGSILDGIPELMEDILNMPVRQGIPMGVMGLTKGLSHPVYATAIGLTKFAAEEATKSRKNPKKSGNSNSIINKILSLVGN